MLQWVYAPSEPDSDSGALLDVLQFGFECMDFVSLSGQIVTAVIQGTRIPLVVHLMSELAFEVINLQGGREMIALAIRYCQSDRNLSTSE